MATPTYAQASTLGSGGGFSSDQITERIKNLLAVLASGQNPDGTAFSLPVSTVGTAGGLTIYRSLDVQPTGQSIKASAGNVYSYSISNQANAPRYFKWYDKATAPTQADTPVMTFVLQAFSSRVQDIADGLSFLNGIAIRATTGIADNDTGAPTANDVVFNLGYK